MKNDHSHVNLWLVIPNRERCSIPCAGRAVQHQDCTQSFFFLSSLKFHDLRQSSGELRLKIDASLETLSCSKKLRVQFWCHVNLHSYQWSVQSAPAESESAHQHQVWLDSWLKFIFTEWPNKHQHKPPTARNFKKLTLWVQTSQKLVDGDRWTFRLSTVDSFFCSICRSRHRWKVFLLSEHRCFVFKNSEWEGYGRSKLVIISQLVRCRDRPDLGCACLLLWQLETPSEGKRWNEEEASFRLAKERAP